ncbi:COG4223 family protein [Pararhodobacter aggregans]
MARKTSNRTRTPKDGGKATQIDEAEIAAGSPGQAEAESPDSSSKQPEHAAVTDPEPPTPEPLPEVPAAEGTDPEVADPAPVALDPAVSDPETPAPVGEEPQPAPAEPEAAVPDAEPVTPAEPEPTPAPLPPPPPPPPAGSSAMPLIFGGFAAAVLGALVVLIFLPNGWQGGAADPDLLRRVQALESNSGGSDSEAVSRLEARIAALEDQGDGGLDDRVTALEARPPATTDLAPLEARIAALESATPAEASVEALGARIDTLESGIDTRIMGSVAAAMAEARAAIDARADSLDAREEDVAAAQQRIARRAALAELVAAAESGAPSPGALETLGDVPADLRPMGEGLPTLAEIQAGFPGNARRALAADPVAPGASLGERVTDFLRAQTGARSLAPREGNDTDAILSRAEARVRAGDLPGALTELDALSAGPAAEMAAWRGSVDARLAALAALAELQAQMENGE